MEDVGMPENDKQRRFCLTLGNSLGKQVVLVDGKEYSVSHSLDENQIRIYFNPMIDANDAMELQDAAAIDVVFNDAATEGDEDQWLGIVNKKHAIPAINIQGAISMAAYAIVTGQFDDIVEKESMIVDGSGQSIKTGGRNEGKSGGVIVTKH
jgi:hypothetical protein